MRLNRSAHTTALVPLCTYAWQIHIYVYVHEYIHMNIYIYNRINMRVVVIATFR